MTEERRPPFGRIRVSPRFAGSRCQPRRMKLTWSTLKAVLVALAALAYGASPVDLIPDFLVGPGQADDAVALVTAAVVILRIIVKSRRLRQRDVTGGATTGS